MGKGLKGGRTRARPSAFPQQGQSSDALLFALRAARLTQFKNLDILITLADSYEDADRPQEAGDTAAKALTAAKAGKATLAPAVRLRMELLQDHVKQ